jgi:hypothetical protein
MVRTSRLEPIAPDPPDRAVFAKGNAVFTKGNGPSTQQGRNPLRLGRRERCEINILIMFCNSKYS